MLPPLCLVCQAVKASGVNNTRTDLVCPGKPSTRGASNSDSQVELVLQLLTRRTTSCRGRGNTPRRDCSWTKFAPHSSSHQHVVQERGRSVSTPRREAQLPPPRFICQTSLPIYTSHRRGMRGQARQVAQSSRCSLNTPRRCRRVCWLPIGEPEI